MGVSALRVFPWLEQLAMPLGLHRVLGPYTQMLTQTCSMEVRLKTLRAPQPSPPSFEAVHTKRVPCSKYVPKQLRSKWDTSHCCPPQRHHPMDRCTNAN